MVRSLETGKLLLSLPIRRQPKKCQEICESFSGQMKNAGVVEIERKNESLVPSQVNSRRKGSVTNEGAWSQTQKSNVVKYTTLQRTIGNIKGVCV